MYFPCGLGKIGSVQFPRFWAISSAHLDLASLFCWLHSAGVIFFPLLYMQAYHPSGPLLPVFKRQAVPVIMYWKKCPKGFQQREIHLFHGAALFELLLVKRGVLSTVLILCLTITSSRACLWKGPTHTQSFAQSLPGEDSVFTFISIHTYDIIL